jgi:putative NADH-flavin reductase
VHAAAYYKISKAIMKNILVIGANGGIGKQSVDMALKAGHHVTALLRNPANLKVTHPNLQIIKGDIMQPRTFENCLHGKDAVISAIGVKGTKPTTLYSQGNSNLLQAMQNAGVRRAFFISASAIEISPVLPFYVRLAEKYIVQKILRNMYNDQRIMERLIKESDADWTIMRPPRLTDKPATGHYRIGINSFLKNCLVISRADVAHFMINNITNEETYKGVVEIGY